MLLSHKWNTRKISYITFAFIKALNVILRKQVHTDLQWSLYKLFTFLNLQGKGTQSFAGRDRIWNRLSHLIEYFLSSKSVLSSGPTVSSCFLVGIRKLFIHGF